MPSGNITERNDSRFDRIESRLDAMIGKLEHIVAIQAHLSHILDQNKKNEARISELERMNVTHQERTTKLEGQASNWRTFGGFALTVISGILVYLATIVIPGKPIVP